MAKYPIYHKSRLPNGITLVSETYPHAQSLSIGVWVRVGSAYEADYEVGLSHCIEHLLFKGTEKRNASEIATALESLGGDLNAFTERELTCFHATVLSEHAEEALEVLSDLSLCPRFDEQELERERQVLLQELMMIEDSPDDVIHDILLSAVWKGQTWGNNIMGSRKNLLAFDRDQIIAHYEKYYRPSNMVIAIAGGVSHRQLLSLCRKYFQRNLQRPPAEPIKKLKPCRFFPGYRKVKGRSDQTHVLMGFAAPAVRDPGRFESLVLSVYLGGGMSSRLFQEIRERAALAYTVESDYIAFEGGGILSFYAGLAAKSLKPCIDIIVRELIRVRDRHIPKDRLESIKSQLRGTLLLSHEMMETRMEALARHEIFFHRYFGINDLIRSVDKVSANSVRETARKLFRESRLGWVVSGRVPPRLPRLLIENA